jgi:predicted AlkP superfamily pyrophosphatase or phosphodiesterase
MRQILACWIALALARAVAWGTEPPLILVSLDGFRWDYLTLFPDAAPTLRVLAREGAAADAVIPVFPSNTFPNHYTIVTGLYPAHHGVINNDFFDPELGAVFRYNQPNAARDSRWWGGEPIWVTAVKQGRKSAASFWVGSEAEIGGVRPTFWRNYDGRLPFDQRLEEFAAWMELPGSERPAIVTMYLEEVNGAGHRYGPTSAEVVAAIKLSDARVAMLLDRARQAGIEPNLIVVSDHGMAQTSLERIVILDDIIDRANVQVDNDGSTAALRPLKGDAASLVRAFANVPHVKAYRAEDLPAHLKLRGNPRIAPVWVLPDEGWHLVLRSSFDRLRNNFRVNGYLQGDHGYDPALPSMHGILIAHGPSFRRGARHPAVENIHLYNLLCAATKLQPAKNDGDDRLATAWLRPAVK